MTTDEQYKQLTEQAMEAACTAAGKYLDKEGLYETLDTEAVVEQVKTEVAERWNETMEDCQEAEKMGGQYTEVVFEAAMTEAGIDAVKTIEKTQKVAGEMK